MTYSKGGRPIDTPKFSDVEIDKLNPFKFPKHLEIGFSHLLDVISIQRQDDFPLNAGQINFHWTTAWETHEESMNAQDTTSFSTTELIKCHASRESLTTSLSPHII